MNRLSSPLRVGFYYPHLSGVVGYPRDVQRLGRDLARATGIEVRQICAHFVKGVRFGLLGDELRTFSELLKSRRELDLVHIFGCFYPSYVLVAEFLKGSEIPYVISPMAALEPHAMALSARRKRLFMALGGARMLRRAAAIHSFGPSETAAIRRFSADTEIFELPFGVYPEDLPAAPGGDSTLGEPQDFFLFFGRMAYFQKGLDLLLDGYRLYLAGGGHWQLRLAGLDWNGSHARIQTRISELSLEGKAILLGATSTEKKYEQMRTCRAFIYPTRFDGPPRPIRDALCLGRPVLVSRQANMPEVSRHGWGIEFDANPQAIADAMGRFEAKPIAEPGSDPSRRLDWQRIAGLFAERYQSILTPRSRCVSPGP